MKKYILFIVEGKNDKKEMQAILRSVCGQAFKEIYVDAYYVHGGDITSEKESSEKNIIIRLNKIVVNWRNGGEEPYQKISTSDVRRIVHIIDMDGAFIPESDIIQTDDGKVKYNNQSIEYFEPNIIMNRNRKKARIIRKLLQVERIDNIPYKIYFASCNMDHVLFDDRNSNTADKGRNAFIFSNTEDINTKIYESVFANNIRAEGTYMESWDMIMEDHNSLLRHTNINLFLKEIIETEDK